MFLMREKPLGSSCTTCRSTAKWGKNSRILNLTWIDNPTLDKFVDIVEQEMAFGYLSCELGS